MAEHKILLDFHGKDAHRLLGCTCGFRTTSDVALTYHIAYHLFGGRKDHEMPTDDEMTPYRGSGKRMLSRDDEIEIFAPGLRHAGPNDWKRAIVCVSDVYKSFGTSFLVQPKDSGEFMVFKYAEEGKTWRRPEPAAADPIWAKEFHGILRSICTELGVEFFDSDPRKSANAALEKARWFRKPNTARETDLQRSFDEVAKEVTYPKVGPIGPADLIEAIRAIRRERDDAYRELARSRNIVNRLAGCMTIGDWNLDGDELVARAGQWQVFAQWLSMFVADADKHRDSFEFGDTKNRVAWNLVCDQLRLVHEKLGASVGALRAQRMKDKLEVPSSPVPGLPWYDRNDHG